MVSTAERLREEHEKNQELCAICGKSRGEHHAADLRCPGRGEGAGRWATTTFKAARSEFTPEQILVATAFVKGADYSSEEAIVKTKAVAGETFTRTTYKPLKNNPRGYYAAEREKNLLGVWGKNPDADKEPNKSQLNAIMSACGTKERITGPLATASHWNRYDCPNAGNPAHPRPPGPTDPALREVRAKLEAKHEELFRNAARAFASGTDFPEVERVKVYTDRSVTGSPRIILSYFGYSIARRTDRSAKMWQHDIHPGAELHRDGVSRLLNQVLDACGSKERVKNGEVFVGSKRVRRLPKIGNEGMPFTCRAAPAESRTPQKPETAVALTAGEMAAAHAFVEGKAYQTKDGDDLVFGGRMGTPVNWQFQRKTIISRVGVKSAQAIIEPGLPKTEPIRARIDQVFQTCGRDTRLNPGWQVEPTRGGAERNWDETRDRVFTCHNAKAVPAITPSARPAAERVPEEAKTAASHFVVGLKFKGGMEEVVVNGKVTYTHEGKQIATRPSRGDNITRLTLVQSIPRTEEARTRLNTVLETCGSETRVRVKDGKWMVQDGAEVRAYAETDTTRSCPNAAEAPVKVVKVTQKTLEGGATAVPLKATMGGFCRTPEVMWKNQGALQACSAAMRPSHDTHVCKKEMASMGFRHLNSGFFRSAYAFGDCVVKIAKGSGGAISNGSEREDIRSLPKDAQKWFLPQHDKGPVPTSSRGSDPQYVWITVPMALTVGQLGESETRQIQGKVRRGLETAGLHCEDLHLHNIGLFEGRPIVVDAGAVGGSHSITCSTRGPRARTFFEKLEKGEVPGFRGEFKLPKRQVEK